MKKPIRYNSTHSYLEWLQDYSNDFFTNNKERIKAVFEEYKREETDISFNGLLYDEIDEHCREEAERITTYYSDCFHICDTFENRPLGFNHKNYFDNAEDLLFSGTYTCLSDCKSLNEVYLHIAYEIVCNVMRDQITDMLEEYAEQKFLEIV